jgi:hypothetical protein
MISATSRMREVQTFLLISSHMHYFDTYQHTSTALSCPYGAVQEFHGLPTQCKNLAATERSAIPQYMKNCEPWNLQP